MSEVTDSLKELTDLETTIQKQLRREYYQMPYIKEKQRNYYKTKIICECGAKVSRGNMSKHKTTVKHQEYLDEKLKENPLYW